MKNLRLRLAVARAAAEAERLDKLAREAQKRLDEDARRIAGKPLTGKSLRRFQKKLRREARQ